MDRKRRQAEGAEEISEAEDEKSEEQMDENGNPLRMQPKIRPFINTPKITPLEQIGLPEVHDTGYVWYLQ